MNSLCNNLSFGKVCITLDEVDSTNSYAKDLLSKSKPSEGTVVFARYQTSGKGQFGKTWESERDKNLTFSIILYPDFLKAQNAHWLNQAVSLALKDFIQSLNIPVRIKWPNDIYHHDKKLAGVLIENSVMGEDMDYSVVGIGVNVNQLKFNKELPNPISLKLISGKEFNIAELLNGVFPFIEGRYLQLKSRQFEEIKKGYAECLYKLNRVANYRSGSESLEGIIQGVNERGQLVIKMNGSIRCFNNNELIFQ